MKALEALPNGPEAIRLQYGDPDANRDFVLDSSWYETYTKAYMLPFPLRLAWAPDQLVSRIRCNIKIAESLLDALDEIATINGTPYLRNNKFDYFGGCFAFRPKRKAGELSAHAWGIAVDINPHLGAMGDIPNMPGFIVEAFERRGWEWGGRWDYPDGMHFQACTGY